ncbi:KAP family P-loop NTPase fold protein [Aliarcobacter butzleri]
MAKGNFTFKSDYKDYKDNLGRDEIAEKYVNFINALDGHHVIALDAPWGSGKSTLIDLMCNDFENNKDVFVKYNAWENDYTEEPLISLMSDLFEKFEAKKYIGKDNCRNLVSNIVKATKLTTKGTLKGLSKIAIGEEATKNLSDACLTIAGTVTEEIADNLFKDIDESKKSRKKFKDELKNYTNKILEEKSKKKLIIIIDELDRCRPTFAIELLENIKHLFDIENIVFFIAVDNEQLAESIKAVYGNGFDANTYLHRFFDFELHLKREDLDYYFMEKLTHRFKNISIYKIDELIISLINVFNLTIRDINKIINEAYILRKLNPTDFDLKFFLVILVIKYKNKDLYEYLKEVNKNFIINSFTNTFSTKTDIRKFIAEHFPLKEKDDLEIMTSTIKRIEETL